MNPNWNTPPNGDFASYVERLSAQAALPRRAPEAGEHGLDVGMTSAADAPGTAPDAAWGRAAEPGAVPVPPRLAEVVQRLGATAARGLRAWAAEVARQQAQQKQRTGRKK